MKIAVTYDNENKEVFQHFGRTQFFKVYDVEDGQVTSSEIIGSNGTGHGALANLLADQSVDVLICGGIGGGAKEALTQAGIQIYGGAAGKADEAAAAFLAGTLSYDPNVHCTHHQEHAGEHSCGGHGHSGHSCGGHTCH